MNEKILLYHTKATAAATKRRAWQKIKIKMK